MYLNFKPNKRLNLTSTALLVLCFFATLAQNNQLRFGSLAGRYILGEKMNIKIFGIILVVFISGCSIASLNKMEHSAEEIDFDKIEKEHDSSGGIIWTWKGKNEYFIYVKNYNTVELMEDLKNSVIENGYSIVANSNESNVVLGERGLRLNEWGSVIGVYIKEGIDFHRVYIKVEITQDITGGWMSNRAKKIGGDFCRKRQSCNITKPSI